MSTAHNTTINRNGGKSPTVMPKTAMIAPVMIIPMPMTGLSRTAGTPKPKAFAPWHIVTKRKGMLIASNLGIWTTASFSSFKNGLRKFFNLVPPKIMSAIGVI